MAKHDAPEERDPRYPQIVRAVSETPWAILPATLAVILDLLAYRAAGNRLSEEEIRERIEAASARRQARKEMPRSGAVAVIPLYGVIVPRADMFTEMSGGTSLQRFAQTFREALNDPEVGAVLIDIDSPGGSTDLVSETAELIREARGGKPIFAIANTLAASAAYWLGAQADELFVSPSGEVGSIGVFAAHDDISSMQEKLGVNTTLISAGKYKTELSPFAPLTDEAKQALQERVDAFYAMFVADVANGRGVAAAAVREGFGEGRVVTARAALAAGMVDRIDTFQATVNRLAGGRVDVPVPEPPDAPDILDEDAAAGVNVVWGAFADDAKAARDAADALVNRARSLAETRRGRLTGAKREQITAIHDSLTETVKSIAALLAGTDPKKHTDAVLREFARDELRQNL